MGRTATRSILILLLGIVALTALVGAFFIVPTLPIDSIKHGPMSDFSIAAVMLALAVGGSSLLAVVLLVRDSSSAGVASMVAGAMIIAFEFVEIMVVGFTVVEGGPDSLLSWRQVFYVGLGVVGIAAGYHLWQVPAAPRVHVRHSR